MKQQHTIFFFFAHIKTNINIEFIKNIYIKSMLTI